MPSTDDTNANAGDPEDDDGQRPFRDAEAWLAEKGIRREPLIVSTPGEQQAPEGAGQPERSSQERPPAPPPIGSPAPPGEAAVAPRDAPGGADAGTESDATAAVSGETGTAQQAPDGPDSARLVDQVKEAAAYARRATANTPLSEARLRSKMESRGYPPPVVTQAMERARKERIVDDHAYAMALVEEGRGKGHAPLRIKTDMQKRDLSDEAIKAALDTIGDRDPQAQAFAVAKKRAERYRDVDTETAYRRLVGYLARRGYTEALSRKVAREAVFNDREPQRIAER